MTKFKVPYCSKCDAKRHGEFCSECGLGLVEAVRTCKCGYDNIWTHENFCQQCGTPAPPMPSSATHHALSQFIPGAERTEASTGKTEASISEEKQ